MSEAEFALHEQMLKYDPDRERDRKELAALQLNRTADEVREEAMLLEELKRITSNEQNFITERRELYSRLEVPISVGNTAMYQSSQGLSQLLQTLLQADKSKKRRSILGPEGAIPSPVGQTPTQATALGRAETPSTTAAAKDTKKGPAVPPTQPAVRTLTPAEEARYGVQHHERLQGGVQFRSDRAQKLTQAKSNVQTQKLASALAELEIPVRLFMPTERVCKDFEKLIQSVNLLLDARKVAEKVESEIRVLEAARAERERKNAPEGSSKDTEHPEVKTEADDGGNSMLGSTAADATESGAPAGGEGQAKGDEGASSQTPVKEDGNHKRSASVLSSVSDKSSKRQRR
jgi:DNA methyltransferase 1-associated protein 1